MPWTITNATITNLSLAVTGGKATQLFITYSTTDSAGNVRTGTTIRNLSGAEQAAVANFLTGLAAQLATDTGLAVGLA